MNKLICLLLAPVALFGQDAAVKFRHHHHHQRLAVRRRFRGRLSIHRELRLHSRGA
jgi:hypothetical protein